MASALEAGAVVWVLTNPVERMIDVTGVFAACAKLPVIRVKAARSAVDTIAAFVA